MRHRTPTIVLGLITLAAALAAVPPLLAAKEPGRLKIARGAVHVERGGQRVPATVGAPIREGDVVVTGADGSAGIAFADDSLLSLGPNSRLSIDRFAFESTTHQGGFQSSLQRGTLAAISGKLAKQSPDAMTIRTPVAIMGVRGTRVLVRTGEAGR
jgi:hypothetical protein